MAVRTLSIGNVLSKRYKTLELDGIYYELFGDVENSGAWLIWGNEKNGKTALALILSEMLSEKNRVLYISAEEGMGKTFQDSIFRAGLDPRNRKLQFTEYIQLDELKMRLNRRISPDIVVIDNCTVYKDDITTKILPELLNKYSNKLFIFLAHEERKEPYTSLAKLVRKLAKAIIYIEGMQGYVSGRVPGGVLPINQQKSELYHGTKNIEQ